MLKKDLYNLCRQVRRLVIKLNGGTTGMCGVATAILFLKLKKLGFNSEICGNDNHIFLEFNDYLIDVTADQFNKFPKIYGRINKKIVITKKRIKKSYLKVDYRFKSLDELYLLQDYWLEQHRVKTYLNYIYEFVDRD